MVGIGGAGMSGIARILLSRGGAVSGSDAKESRGVLALRARGAQVRIGHDASALDLLPGGPTVVVTTHAAIPKTIRNWWRRTGARSRCCCARRCSRR